ncbi:helix-turn-helix domain-containing protein [Paenibacillus sp. IB182496]|uniref:Helix-turn-helix domain-containing protein n=1 Tax=Paenibacillus sabuli TaxID=2772509 RepID=A0A927BSD8_9BACL|nr:helix-turn-helix domain-containing protein [Paenibacillus sabuli]MBD2845046.1 helix-turn-helix domain-containing protein [Paenibacillus sabuli]
MRTPDVTCRWNAEIAAKLDGFPVHVQCRDRIAATTWHRQPGIEIHLVHEGAATFYAANGETLQQARQLIIHDASMPHRFVAETAPTYRRSVLCILPESDRGVASRESADLRELLPTGNSQYALDGRAYAHLADAMAAIANEMTQRRAGWRQMTYSHLLHALVTIHRLPSEAPPPNHSSLVRQCAAYVRDHLEDDLSLRRMSSLFAVGEEQLIRLFQKELGTSFHQYVLHVKIEKSKRLLCDCPELSLVDVALSCGFSSSSHFSRAFHQRCGTPPSAYRRDARGM